MSQFSIIGTPLYQWETGRKLRVIPLRGMSIDSVHFSNYGDTTALVVKPKEENGAFIADIPNVLLQDDQNIVVYSVNVSEDKTETIRECVFPVRKRAKPSNYIYTETEVFTYKALEARLKKLEEEGTGGVDEGQVKEVIKGYLIENPIEESDPTVPDWAKQPQKPTYTAKEVGAIPEGGDLSASVDFQEVHTEIVRADELTITAGDEGEKSISMWYGGKTADGKRRVVDIVDGEHNRPGTIFRGIADPEQEDDTTNKRYVDEVFKKAGIQVEGAEVGQFLKVSAVDEKGVPTAWEVAGIPAGGSNSFRLLRKITIPEDITTDTSGLIFFYAQDGIGVCVGFDTDENGEPFAVRELYLRSNATSSASGSGNIAISLSQIGFGNTYQYTLSSSAFAKNSNSNSNNVQNTSSAYVLMFGKGRYFAVGTTGSSGSGSVNHSASNGSELREVFESVRILTGNNAVGFMPGSVFEIYGR